MEQYIINLIQSYGYLGMFLGMLLEAVIIVIPSELILAMGGILAQQGHMTFMGAFLTGLAGSLACALIIYYIGYFGGRPFVKKYGKYFFMKEHEIEVADKWFNKYGMWAALIGRNFPIVRTLISFPIGVTRLSVTKFMAFSLVGSIPWTFAFVGAGYTLGKNWKKLLVFVDFLRIPIIIGLIALVVIFIYIKLFKVKQSK